MKHNAVLAALVFVALLAGPIGAQDDDLIQVDPKQGGWEVVELLKTVSEYSEVTIVYDPNYPGVARRKLDFEGPAKVGKEEVFHWFRAVLFGERLVLTPVGPPSGRTYMLTDMNSPNVVTHPIHVPAESLEQWKDRDGAYIVTTIKLKHLRDTARARNALAQLATRQVGRVTDSPTSQSIVIGDFAPMVCAMKKLLDDLDKNAAATDPAVRAGADPQIKQYEQKLAQCNTETAAKYFIGRIEALIPKK